MVPFLSPHRQWEWSWHRCLPPIPLMIFPWNSKFYNTCIDISWRLIGSKQDLVHTISWYLQNLFRIILVGEISSHYFDGIWFFIQISLVEQAPEISFVMKISMMPSSDEINPTVIFVCTGLGKCSSTRSTLIHQWEPRKLISKKFW